MALRPSRDPLAWTDAAVIALFALTCFAFGGSSRPFALSAFVVRPIAAICLTILALRLRRSALAVIRVPLLLLGTLAATIAVQLVPLPSWIWASLQGRAPYEAALASLGLGGQAHPLSLSPDQTWNSLVALIVPLAMLICYAVSSPKVRAALLPALIAGAMASSVLAIAQFAGGPDSVLYFYGASDCPPGIFANRNHQAAFLAIMFPALRAWALQTPFPTRIRGDDFGASRQSSVTPRALAATGIGIFLVPMILATGSRAGLILMVIGLVMAWAIAPWRPDLSRRTGAGWAMLAGLAALATALGATMIASGRLVALQRIIISHDVGGDLRAVYLPTMLTIVRRFWLFGAGFGTFDPVLRGSEPDALLRADYLNNAHNELIELAISGGIASLAVLVAFLLWWARWTRAAFVAPAEPAVYRARAAAVMIGMLLAASLVDYPLRTPLLGAVLSLLCAWVADTPTSHRIAVATAVADDYPHRKRGKNERASIEHE